MQSIYIINVGLVLVLTSVGFMGFANHGLRTSSARYVRIGSNIGRVAALLSLLETVYTSFIPDTVFGLYWQTWALVALILLGMSELGRYTAAKIDSRRSTPCES